MGVPGLSPYHVKSHLQKFRNGKITVRNWCTAPVKYNKKWKPLLDGQKSAGNSTVSTSSRENENGSNAKKTSRANKGCQPGYIYEKIQAATLLKERDEVKQKLYAEIASGNARKKLNNNDQNNTRMGDNQNAIGGSMFKLVDLSGYANLEKGSVTTPLYSAQQQKQPQPQQPSYSNRYNSVERMQNCLGLGKKSCTVSAGHQRPSYSKVLNSMELVQNHLELDEKYRTVSDLFTANGGCFMTSNGHSIPGPYNNSKSSAINNVLVGMQEQPSSFHNLNGVNDFPPGNEARAVHHQLAQYSVGLQGKTQGLQYQNGVYNFQPENEARDVVQPSQYSVGLQEKTLGLHYQDGFYDFQTGNIETPAVQRQPEQYSIGIQEQTPGLQYQNGVNNFQLGNEAHGVQLQPAQDGVGLQEKFPGLQNQHGLYSFQLGNDAHRVQPAQDGVGLQEQYPGNLYNQNGVYNNLKVGNEAQRIQPAQEGVGFQEQPQGFQNLESPEELDVSDFDIVDIEIVDSECYFTGPFGFAGQPCKRNMWGLCN
ncbi:hypothetical protein QYF36_010362 [Acer negundo]|nr:hypothetical protein QYF36_010362 [Acer negundo]